MFNLPLTPELLSFKSFNDFQFSNNHLRNQHPSLRDVLREPAVLVMKSSPEATDLEAYILERGLSSLAENPSTRFIHDKIKNGADKNAVVAHPAMLLKTPAFKTLKEMPVKKTEIAGSIKFANLARFLNTNLPFIFIYDEENLDSFDSDGLIRLGSLDVSDNKIQWSSCYLITKIRRNLPLSTCPYDVKSMF